VQPVSTTVSAPNLAAAAPSEAAVMAQASSENFPVATHLLGRRQRAHLLAIYGFARLVDDIGDEAPGDRTGLLDWLEGDLDRVYDGQRPEHPVMRRLQAAVGACALPDEPFRRLIEANRRDQVVSRYETFDELLGYCHLSAAPVGELVLHVFGAATRDRIALSDRICAALQVIEHLQDVAEDHARERVYLPRADMRRFGCEERDLAAGAAGPALRALIAFESGRARSLLAEGLPLVRRLAARPRIAVAGFIGGGRAALDALEREGYDVLGTRARPTRRLLAARWLNATAGR
jgi:squalene synthase HpnC